ncbi:unnamed protein product [Caenorhabditis nigoni]
MFCIHWIWVCFMFIFELQKLGCTVIYKAFWRNRNAKMQIRKQSQRLGYPSVVSIFQNLSKEKRDKLVDKCPFFIKLDKRIPYRWTCAGHIVFDIFLKSWKLRHLIIIAKLLMYDFFFTTEFLPLPFRKWLRRKLNYHNEAGINSGLNPLLNRIGTVINYFFVELISVSEILGTTVPLMINNLIVNFYIGDEYVPNFFKKLEKSKIRNLDFNLEQLPAFVNNEEILRTVLKDMTTLTAQNVRVFAHMVPTASLQTIWKMNAQTMELFDEFASRTRVLQVCDDLRSGKVTFNRFQYTGYLRIAGDQFGDFWDQVKERVRFGIDDKVRGNGNSIHFKTSDEVLEIPTISNCELFSSKSQKNYKPSVLSQSYTD